MSAPHDSNRALLRRIAERAMQTRGLFPLFSNDVSAEVRTFDAQGDTLPATDANVRDQTQLLWCSIDNDDSRDLDQLTVAGPTSNGRDVVLVAIADVDAYVPKDSAIDRHARQNTTSVYTSAEVFPMLPERLSTDLTSLNPEVERLALVVEMTVDNTGAVVQSDVYRARVRNHAKLAYNSVAPWLEGAAPMPAALAAVARLADNLQQQDRVAQRLRQLRHTNGALDLETLQTKPVFAGDQLSDVAIERPNRAKQLIENFMIAANGVTARFLSAHHFPSIRRIVRSPKRWDRIVAFAHEHGATLPETPDPVALDAFLASARAADPLRFADVSLSVIKMLGAGQYVAQRPDDTTAGHFGLAVRDYAHSTAPNRRYPDLLTQRLVKAALAGQQPPYTFDELEQLAAHFTTQEDAAKKVERQIEKSTAALLLQSRLGQEFDALVTGAAEKGTWARLLKIPAEGRVVRGFEGADVGDAIRVRLESVDVERGYIDLVRTDAGAGHSRH